MSKINVTQLPDNLRNMRAHLRNAYLMCDIREIQEAKIMVDGTLSHHEWKRKFLQEMIDECKEGGVSTPADLPL